MEQLITSTLNAIYYSNDVTSSCSKCKQIMQERNYTKEQQNKVEFEIATHLLDDGFTISIPLFK